MTYKLFLASIFYWVSSSAWSADVAVQTSPTGGLLKMFLGLILVLGVMAGVAWLAKRMLPVVGHKQSTIQVVGSANVGTRERVVVLEVAGRWLVVGVAPGHVSAIANLEKSTVEDDFAVTDGLGVSNHPAASVATSFGKILKSTTSKFTEKTNG
jgi:flagellar protein FliO/FliZ